MKLFDKIKNVFKGNKEETVLNYDKGLKKTREEGFDKGLVVAATTAAH